MVRPVIQGSERKRFQQDIVNQVVNRCAVRFGLSPDTFSTKSFKNCGISTIQLHKEELKLKDQGVAKQFDLSTVSSSQHYQRPNIDIVGPLAFLKEDDQLYAHRNLEILEDVRQSVSSSASVSSSLLPDKANSIVTRKPRN